MISFTSPSFVLRSSDVGNADRLLQVLTRDRGVLSVIAKGITKPESKLRASAGQHMLLETYIIAQRRFTLGGSVIQDPYPHIRTSYGAFWFADHCAELMLQLLEKEYHDPQLFDFFQATLDLCNRRANSPIERFIISAVSFDLHVISHLGLAPRLDQCAQCKKIVRATGIRSQGVFCQDCAAEAGAAKLSEQARKVLMFCQKNNGEATYRLRCPRQIAVEAYQADMILLQDHLASQMQSNVALSDL